MDNNTTEEKKCLTCGSTLVADSCVNCNTSEDQTAPETPAVEITPGTPEVETTPEVEIETPAPAPETAA